MDASNFPNSFTADIAAYFLGNGWSTNVVDNSVSFRGVVHFVFTFTHFGHSVDAGWSRGCHFLHAASHTQQSFGKLLFASFIVKNNIRNI